MRRKSVVSKEVVEAAQREGVDIDAIMRELLKLPALHPGAWVVKGVTFPVGTFFRTWHKDRPYWGEVRDGALWVEGKRFTTPSEATMVFSDPPINGWRVWECKFPTTRSWVPIFDLRGAAAHD